MWKQLRAPPTSHRDQDNTAGNRQTSEDRRQWNRLMGLASRLDRSNIYNLLSLRIGYTLVDKHKHPQNDQENSRNRCGFHRYLFLSLRESVPRTTVTNHLLTRSLTLLRKSVRAMRPPLGCPRAKDSATWRACVVETLGGIGGSKGSTTASTIAGFLE